MVTGGSRGIGAAIVRRLASQGAAVAVLTQDGHLGATYELGGTPFTLTALAATISDVLGTNIAYQDMSVSDYTGVLTGSGLPPEMAAAVADADAGLARGELFTASDDLVKLIGRPATTAHEAIQNSAASLTGSRARLEAVGVVLGQLRPPPSAANASATRISPRSRHEVPARRGMTLIKRGPGAGRKSSRSYDDDSSSQARGSQIQAGNGIVTHRIKIGLAMNSSSTVSAELGLRLVTTPQTIVPLTGSLFYSGQDPYAVRIAFHAGLEEPVEWIFARDLLSRGIQGVAFEDRRTCPLSSPEHQGLLGRLVVDQLLAAGASPAQVVATGGDAGKLAGLAQSGVTVRRSDFADPSTLDEAF